MSNPPRSKSLVPLIILLLVIILGESYALLLEYQNNEFLRDYVATNTTLVATRFAGLLIAALGAAYLAHLASRAGPLSRPRRVSRRIVSLSPLIIGVFAILLWFAVFNQFVPGSTLYFELYLVGVLLAISAGLMVRDRITLRMAVRNFNRRKANMAIIIVGLMIGTAMISGSLVTGDTLTELFTKGAYYGYGYADEVVYARNPITFGYQYFNASLYQGLSTRLTSDSQAGKYVLGVTPEILDVVSVNDTDKGLVQTGATLIGTYPNATTSLGDFHAADKSIISSNLASTETIINDKAARDLNATVGDTIRVNSAQVLPFQIVGIAVSDARGSFSQGDNIFVTLSMAQQLTSHLGLVNFLAITNTGGLRDSIQYSQTVGLAANQTLNQLQQSVTPCKSSTTSTPGTPTGACAYAQKKAAVDRATDGAKSLSNFFLIFSSFSIIAGVVLIVNIFVMLAEERKSEMGMARAVGMKRGQLIKLFLFEGSFYAAGAALVGVFAGIGIGYVILYFIARLFSTFAQASFSQVLDSFTVTTASLFTAFTAGLLITFFTILIASWRVSKLNIIRAIRNISEPPRGKRTYTLLLVLGFLLIAAGSFLFRDSFSARSALEALVGPSLLVFGLGLMLSRFIRNRFAFTFIGVGLLVLWGVPNFSWQNPVINGYDLSVYVYLAGGFIMVLASILLIAYNTPLILRFFHLFYRGRKILTAIFRVALSYPENKRFRTAATVGMFALILFTVSALASIIQEQNATLDKIVKQQTGGYDILALTVPVSNLTQTIQANSALRNDLAAVTPFTTLELSWAQDSQLGRNFTQPLLAGADPDAVGQANFFTTNAFNMTSIARGYSSPRAVWDTVRTNTSYAVWSNGANVLGPGQNGNPNPGDTLVLYLQAPSGTLVSKSVKILGIVNSINGIIVSSHLLRDTYSVQTSSLSLMIVKSGVDPVPVSNLLRRTFLSIDMQTVVIPVVIAQGIAIFSSFLSLFEGFLGLGLVVGIAGLGIISVRSVVERRVEIGVLRALGFRRRMVLATFFLESSYVALLGILIGVVLGVYLAYVLTISQNSPFTGIPFVIPWQSILEIGGISYALAILATLSSARRASRIPPAEALRYSE